MNDCMGLYDPEKPIAVEDDVFNLYKKDFDDSEDVVVEGEPYNEEEKAFYLELPDLKELVPKEILMNKKDKKAGEQFGGRDETQIQDDFFKRIKECMR